MTDTATAAPFACVVCGRPLDYAPLTVGERGATGTPAGVYCDDDAERLHEADDQNDEQYALTEAERHAVAEALRFAAATGSPNLTAPAAQTLAAIADRLTLPPHGVLTHWSPVTGGPALRTADLAPWDRIRVPHPTTGGIVRAHVLDVRDATGEPDGEGGTLTGYRVHVDLVGGGAAFLDADAAEVWGTW